MGFDFCAGHTFHSPAWRPHQLCFRRIKLPELTADNSLPPGTKVKNAWSYTSTPPNGTVSEQTHRCHL